MLLDLQNLFSDNQKITTGTIYSDNIISFGKNDVSFAPLIIQVVEDFSDLTSLKVTIQTSDTAEFSSSTDLIEATMLLDNLKAGAKFPISHLPKGNKGYMRIAYEVSGTTETTGAITAGVTTCNGLEIHEI